MNTHNECSILSHTPLIMNVPNVALCGRAFELEGSIGLRVIRIIGLDTGHCDIFCIQGGRERMDSGEKERRWREGVERVKRG